MDHTNEECVEQAASSSFLSSGSTAGAAVVPLHLEQEPVAQHTALQRWYRGVPLALGSGSTAGDTAGGTARLEKLAKHPTVPERYYHWTSLFLNKGPYRYYRQYSGSTARPGSYCTSCGTAATGVWRTPGTVGCPVAVVPLAQR